MKLLFAAALSLLVGCASIEENPATAKLAVQIATLKVIERAEDQDHRRQRIVELAEEALALAESEAVLVSAVEAAVREAVQWGNLPPSDRLLADYLITLVATELNERVGDGNWLTGKRLVAARQVLAWVVEAAR